MPLLVEDRRKLATVETITNIKPIPGADQIVQASVRGWTIVVKRDEFTDGDTVIYIETDTALPVSDPKYAFLAPRGTKVEDGETYHVLKTARLRGVYSQGLVLPISDFTDTLDVDTLTVGDDVTSMLGLMKWEAPMPVGNGATKGAFPTDYVAKSDAERVQNLGDSWDIIASHEWVALEKLDGQSLTVVRDYDGNVRVASRNWELHEGDNTFWNLTNKYRLAENLQPGEAVQAEATGPGIQGNRQGVTQLRPYVFNFVKDKQVVPYAEWPQWALDLAAPVVDLPFPATIQEAVEQVDGLKSLVDPKRLAEGVVWHSTTGTTFPELGNRSMWKAINNQYLLKD